MLFRSPPFGSENNVIPICPLQSSLRLTLNENSKKVIRTISYKQFPITAAYALTDYRAQGQSIPAVIIDLAPPPTGKLSLFNLYVALSRSSGRDTIRLLRDYDEKALTSTHLPELSSEDDRLRRLNSNTKLWWQKITNEQADPHDGKPFIILSI